MNYSATIYGVSTRALSLLIRRKLRRIKT